MSLKKVLQDLDLPEALMNEKTLWVPIKPSFSSGIIHPNGFLCTSFVTFSDDARLHYEKIYDEAFVGKFVGYEALSFNEFLVSSENYCSKCSLETFMKSDAFVSSYDVFNVSVFLKNIKDKKARLLEGASPFFLRDWQLFNDSSSFNEVMESFSSLNVLNDEVREHVHESLFPDEASKLTFKKQLIEFVSSELLTFSNIENDVAVAPLHDIMKECKDKIENELLTNESFVVFNSTFLDEDRVRTFLNKDVSRHLFGKVILNPMLKIGSFSVLPYLEFQFLNHFTKKLTPNFNEIFANVYVASEFPSESLIETVKSLYAKNNETMSQLQNLFEIAESV